MKGTFRKSSIKTDDIKDKVMSYWNWERWNENIRVEVMRAIDLTIKELEDKLKETINHNKIMGTCGVHKNCYVAYCRQCIDDKLKEKDKEIERLENANEVLSNDVIEEVNMNQKLKQQLQDQRKSGIEDGSLGLVTKKDVELFHNIAEEQRDKKDEINRKYQLLRKKIDELKNILDRKDNEAYRDIYNLTEAWNNLQKQNQELLTNNQILVENAHKQMADYWKEKIRKRIEELEEQEKMSNGIIQVNSKSRIERRAIIKELKSLVESEKTSEGTTRGNISLCAPKQLSENSIKEKKGDK